MTGECSSILRRKAERPPAGKASLSVNGTFGLATRFERRSGAAVRLQRLVRRPVAIQSEMDNGCHALDAPAHSYGCEALGL
jgi:hypothetical protein